jgi:shikimate dehydrogenase
MSLQERDILLEGRKALMIGAGGASRAVGYYLSRSAGALHLYNRSRDKAEILAEHLSRQGGKAEVIGSLPSLDAYDIIINATSLGLKDDDPLPFDPGMLHPAQVVCDLIYRKTPLLIRAEEKGCNVIDGLGMLLWQGAYAFQLWTGIEPPIEIMRTVLLNFVK